MRTRYGMAPLRQLASWNSSRLAPFRGSIPDRTCHNLRPLRQRTTTPNIAETTFRPFSTFTENESGTSHSRENGHAVEELSIHSSDTGTDTTAMNPRLFINPNFPLEYRVNKLLDQPLGTMHPLDIVLTAKDLIRECCKRRSLEGMKCAHDILDRLLEEKHCFNQLRTPDDKPQPYAIVIPEKTFEVLMFGWANLCRKVPIATTRMREVLDLMIREAEYDQALRVEREEEGIVVPNQQRVHGRKYSDLEAWEMFATMSCQPSIGIYNTLLSGLAQGAYRSMVCATEAEDTLKKMKRLAHRKGWHTKPNTESFMYVLTAFARTHHPTAGVRAEKVLRKMILYHAEQIELYREENGEEYDLVNVDNNVRRVVTPDARAYTAVIQAYGALGTSDKALRLLTEFLESTNPHLIPDAYIFAATINAFARKAAKATLPETRREAAQASEDILRLMIDLLLSQATQDKSLLTSSIPFNVCMNAWANANVKESPTQATKILEMLLDPEFSDKTGIKATTISFNTCMHAWSRAARRDRLAPQRAEDLLQLMEQVDYVRPDVTSYTTIINAYANSNRPDKISHARRVLEALLTNLPSLGQVSVIPFNMVLNAIVSSPIRRQSPDRAVADPFGVKNDGPPNSDLDAYSLAMKIYDEVCSDVYDLGVTPDHLFFATVIDVIAKYTSPDSIERRQRLDQVFQQTSLSGEVSVNVVEALSRACPSQEMFQTMLGLQRWPIEAISILPRAWTCKVPPGYRKFKPNPAETSRQGAQGSHRSPVG